MRTGHMNMRLNGEVARRQALAWVELRKALEGAWELAFGLPLAAKVPAISVEEVMQDLSYGRD